MDKVIEASEKFKSALKVVSVLACVIAAIYFVIAIFYAVTIFGYWSQTAHFIYVETFMDMYLLDIIEALFCFLEGMIYLAIALLGFRAAKNTKKINAFFWVSLIVMILIIMSTLEELLTGEFNFFSFCITALIIACLLIAALTKRNNKKQQPVQYQVQQQTLPSQYAPSQSQQTISDVSHMPAKPSPSSQAPIASKDSVPLSASASTLTPTADLQQADSLNQTSISANTSDTEDGFSSKEEVSKSSEDESN